MPVKWNRKEWVRVLLYVLLIFFTIPVTRKIQGLVYTSVGREFFTYLVLSVVACGLTGLIYFFIFKLKVKEISQYVWITICAGLYIYLTIQLRKIPEESIHLIEYGLLSYFVFKALSHRIQDWTIYITGSLVVSLIGITDEVIQWMIPKRYWDFRDIGINIFAGVVFQLLIWKGIKPDIISKPLKKISIRILVGVLTVDLFLFGLCLSNTPDAVKRYTAIIKSLSWLQAEEPMSEFGYVKTAWLLIFILLFAAWMLAARWIKKAE